MGLSVLASLALADEDFEGCAFETKLGPKLIFEKARIGGRKSVWLGTEQDERRWADADL